MDRADDGGQCFGQVNFDQVIDRCRFTGVAVTLVLPGGATGGVTGGASSSTSTQMLLPSITIFSSLLAISISLLLRSRPGEPSQKDTGHGQAHQAG